MLPALMSSRGGSPYGRVSISPRPPTAPHTTHGHQHQVRTFSARSHLQTPMTGSAMAAATTALYGGSSSGGNMPSSGRRVSAGFGGARLAPTTPRGSRSTPRRSTARGSKLVEGLGLLGGEGAASAAADSPSRQLGLVAGAGGISSGDAGNGVLFSANPRSGLRAAMAGRDCDPIEVAENVFGPAFTHLSTGQQLTTLERECHVAESEKRFTDAQICHDLLHQISQNCASRAQRAVQERIKKLVPVRAKLALNQEELTDFTRMWEKELATYDAKSEEAVNDLKAKQARENDEQEQLLRANLGTVIPHFSKRVLDLRTELTKLLNLKQFREADGIHRDLTALERKETHQFEQELGLKLQKQMKQLTQRQKREMDSLTKRVIQAREELLAQRRADHETLVMRHAIQTGEVDRRSRVQLRQEHKHLQRQAVLLARRPGHAVELFSDF